MTSDDERSVHSKDDDCSYDSDANDLLNSIHQHSSRHQQRRCGKSKIRGPTFTAVESLLVAQAYVKASKNSTTGAKQKLNHFQLQIEAAYNLLKENQERWEKHEMEKPVHMRSSSLFFHAEPYPKRSGGSLYQHFKKKIAPAVMKFMGLVKQVSSSTRIFVVLASSY